ncbi:MAG TPA: alpha-glucan family phosphorylase [Candidatus Nanoarchaeia archaeon]|nr:alpha-glucan family phosphorylase [Candidatus Nanoarchaeia archaeon]
MKPIAAYFSAEFGLEQGAGVPVYSGGLGILSGDFLKGCANLGLPIIGVGLYYNKGIPHQKLDASGWQTEYYRPVIPTGALKTLDEKVSVPIAGGSLEVTAFEVPVYSSVPGSKHYVPLVLLKEDNQVGYLYPGQDKENRLRQEMILGVGGFEMLKALGHPIQIYHANEGHSALMLLPLIEKYGSLDKAREHMVFTTHTLVPAGIDAFSKETAQKVMHEHMLKQAYRLSGYEGVHMMRIGMNAGISHGVSKPHQVASQYIFRDFPNIEQLTYKDNGIDIPTWASPEAQRLYNCIAPGWITNPQSLEKAVLEAPQDSIMQSRLTPRWRLGQYLDNDPHVIRNTGYDPKRLMIGFARRAAPYKQATLVLQNVGKLGAYKDKIGIVFAGKAHPADNEGKKVIQEIIHYLKEREIPMWFVEDYNMASARTLTQGVDLWLNTPRILEEAAGTSGMKAAANGVPQFSTIDGWWYPQNPPEGYILPKGLVPGLTGWGLGRTPTSEDLKLLLGTEPALAQRKADKEKDSVELVEKLKYEILPMFEPDKEWMQKRRWPTVVQGAMTNASYFNTIRLAQETFRDIYRIN